MANAGRKKRSAKKISCRRIHSGGHRHDHRRQSNRKRHLELLDQIDSSTPTALIAPNDYVHVFKQDPVLFNNEYDNLNVDNTLPTIYLAPDDYTHIYHRYNNDSGPTGPSGPSGPSGTQSRTKTVENLNNKEQAKKKSKDKLAHKTGKRKRGKVRMFSPEQHSDSNDFIQCYPRCPSMIKSRTSGELNHQPNNQINLINNQRSKHRLNKTGSGSLGSKERAKMAADTGGTPGKRPSKSKSLTVKLSKQMAIPKSLFDVLKKFISRL